MKDILTTFEIARLCNVDITTVINWIDSGKLVAYKTPGGHRRIRKEEFLQFLKTYHLPIPRGITAMGKTILIVDDDGKIRKFIRLVIKENWPEFEICEAEDGFAAGKLLAEKMPNLVTLDIRLPGADGVQVCKMIRADRRLTHTKIMAITGYHSEAARDGIIAAGANDYVTKPFTPEELARRIEKLLL